MVKTSEPRVVSPEELDRVMEFDHVIEVLADGRVIDRPDVYAPNLLDDELDDAEHWSMLNGYSGQDRYRGPVMHNSEFIGGGMARDILETPGVYVAVVAYWSPEEDDADAETDAEGWAVAKLEGEARP